MKRIPKRLGKGTFLEGQNGFGVAVRCVINISRNGCYHGLYLRKLHWFTLEYVQKVPLVVENELSKVGGKSFSLIWLAKQNQKQNHSHWFG